MKALFSKFFFHWVDKRNDPRNLYKLTQRRLYILPTAKGFLFLLLVVVMWLMGTNYQNNLILAISFFLLAVFLVTIMRTYSNLSGMEIGFHSHEPVYAGDHAKISFALFCQSRAVEAISLAWQNDSEQGEAETVKKRDHYYYDTTLGTEKRGVMRLPRLIVQSGFPFGIIRCWSWLNFNSKIIVYPKPLECAQPMSLVADSESATAVKTSQGDDFAGLARYREGDSMQRIAWKQFARGQGLHTKDFEQSVSTAVWLDYFSIEGADVEEKISGLSYWALKFDQAGYEYGLNLPNQQIDPHKGDEHFHRVMKSLALFQH